MKTGVLGFVHTVQAGFSAYNLYLASISIQNLQGYEGMSEKAAKYSNTAEHQLHKTRTTQASGTIAVLFSLVSSVYMLAGSPGLSRQLTVVGLNVVALEGARQHVGAFWKQSARIPIPGAGDYNQAEKNTQEIKINLAYLAASWVGAGALLALTI